MLNVQRTVKYARVQELEGLLVEANREIERLNQMIESQVERTHKNKEFKRLLKIIETQAT
jgi:hypothetical protein